MESFDTNKESFQNRGKILQDWLILQHEFGEDLVLCTKPVPVSFFRESHAASLDSMTRGVSSKQMSDSVKTSSSVVLPSFSEASSARSPQENKEIVMKNNSDHDLSMDHTVDLKAIKTLKDLKQALFNFEGCALKKHALHTVFGDGNSDSPVMLIGEGPGAEEDQQGLPFVGRSGQLLNKMLASIGLSRQTVYITNVVNWRPPDNRTPEPLEIQQCLPFLKKHIDLIHPRFLILLGATAMRAVLNLNAGLSRARGIWHSYKLSSGQSVKTMVTFHPSYLLRSPGQKKFAWEDLLRLKSELEQDPECAKFFGF